MHYQIPYGCRMPLANEWFQIRKKNSVLKCKYMFCTICQLVQLINCTAQFADLQFAQYHKVWFKCTWLLSTYFFTFLCRLYIRGACVYIVGIEKRSFVQEWLFLAVFHSALLRSLQRSSLGTSQNLPNHTECLWGTRLTIKSPFITDMAKRM